jgi:hypothetical protein
VQRLVRLKKCVLAKEDDFEKKKLIFFFLFDVYLFLQRLGTSLLDLVYILSNILPVKNKTIKMH